MSIIRGPRPDAKFYTVSKDISEDRRLSWAARGLLIFLLGKPDNWRISVQHLISQTENCLGVPAKRDAVYSLLAELQAAGYVRRAQARVEGGRFQGVEYVVSEAPVTAAPLTDDPYTAEPDTANPTLINTKKKTKTEEEAKNQLESRTRKARAATAECDKAKKRSKLPVNFKPTDKHAAYAAEHGLELQTELAKFELYHAEQATLSASWNASFSRWLLNAVEYRKKPVGGGVGVGQGRKNAPAGHHGAANGKLLGKDGQPKDYLKGVNDDGTANF